MSRPATACAAAPELWRLFRRFRPALRAQVWLIVGASAGTLAEVFLRLVEPWPLKLVIDFLFAVARGQPIDGRTPFGGIGPTALLAGCAAAVVVLAALRAAAAYVSTVGFALAGNRVLAECRREVFAHVLRLPMAYHTRSNRGDLANRLIGDISRVQDVLVTAALPLASHALTLAGMIAVMLIMNLQLGLLALAVVPVFALASVRIGRRIKAVSREQRKREGEMAGSAAETINAIRVVQAYSLQRLRSAAFDRQNRASLREGVRGARLSAGLERSVDVIIALGTAAVLWAGAGLAVKGEISPGDLVVFLAYLKNAFKPMRDTAKFAGRLAKAGASGERILELLDTQPSIADGPEAVEAPDPIEEITLAGVMCRYPGGPPILAGLDITIPAGRTVAIVGPSGAGKSTVLSLLCRLMDPSEGSVRLNNHDIRGFTLESLRARFAVVLQESVLFAGSVRDNIACGRPSASDEEVVAAARLAGADEFIAAMPRGYETIIGERGETLSGGQRQRIALARAALRAAPVLILDEPTTGLDNQSRGVVLGALARLAAGRTCIIISHDLVAVENADLIYFLDHGRVIEQGTHTELVGLGGRYAAMHAAQAAEPVAAEGCHAVSG